MNFFKKKSFESVKESGSTSGLNKTLTAFDLILLGLGGIVGTGVFALTGVTAAEHSGPAVTISYAIAGFVCIFVALAYTELATMLPTSGSIYTYSYVAFGEVIAWLVGGIILIEFGIAASAVAGSWSSYIQVLMKSAGYVMPDILAKTPFEGGMINLPAFLIIIFVGSLLYFGTKESKKINNILVLVKMLAISIFVIFAAPHFDIANWENFIPYGFDDVLIGSSILFFAFTGFGTLASAAEECKNPKKDLTIGIIGSLVLSTIVYIIVAAVLTGMVPFTELNSAEALANALSMKGSKIGSILVATGAVAGMTTVIMVNIYGQSRIFYVISRDGLLPKFLSKVHPKYDSPYMSIIFFTLMIAILGAFVPFNLLAKLSSMAALADYILVAIIVMIFRFTQKNAERSFRCPLVFIVAPFALCSSVFLLLKQVFDINGKMLVTGQLFISWFAIVLVLYFVRALFVQRKDGDTSSTVINN